MSSEISVKVQRPRYGRYEVLGEIAKGGMGVVYLCRLPGEGGFQRLFGLKVMHPHLAADAELVKLLMREAKLAARITHPNVVGTIDFGLHDDRYYMVLDYVDGFSLGVMLDLKPQLRSFRLIVPVILDALRGLHAAHTLKDLDGQLTPVVHQDVSPDNILVGTDGSARLTDFGIARPTAATTVDGDLRGKAEYISPDRLLGHESNPRSDLFAMGTVMWNLLTGEKLFKSDTAATTMYNVLKREIEPPSQRLAHPPKELDAVILRALERDPEKRYQSAAEMAAALEAAVAPIGPLASKEQIGEWVRACSPEDLERRANLVRNAGLYTSLPPELQALSRTGSNSKMGPLPDLSGSNTAPLGRGGWVTVIAVTALVSVGLFMALTQFSSNGRLPPDRERSQATAAVAVVPEDDLARPVSPAPFAPTAPEPIAEVKVSVASEPQGANVFIDGVLRGTAPVELRLTKSDAETRIILQHDGFKTFEKAIVPESDQKLTITMQREPPPVRRAPHVPPTRKTQRGDFYGFD